MISSWILFAISAGLASNLFNFLNRYVLQKEDDSTAYGWFTEVVRLSIAFIILPFMPFFKPTLVTLEIFIALGIIEIASIYLFMKMHRFTHLSISTIISRTRLIWIPIITFLLFHETLKLTEYAGIAVLFFGLSIAISPRKILIDKGVIYAYLSSVVLGFLAVALKQATPVMSIPLILIGQSLLATIILPIIMKNAQKRIRTTIKKNLPLKILASFANTFAMILYTYALNIGNVSKVTAIYQGMMIVSILAGILFLREREGVVKKMVGAGVTLIGVYLLTVL